MNDYMFRLHVAAAIFSAIALMVLVLKPIPKSVVVPERAMTVGPEYMKIWADESRVFIVLRRFPHLKIKIDRRIAKELSERLAQLN